MTEPRASTADDTVLEMWACLPEYDSRTLTEFAADLRWQDGRWQDICSATFLSFAVQCGPGRPLAVRIAPGAA